MKNIDKILTLTLPLLLCSQLHAQSFKKGMKHFDMRLDFGVYSGTVEDNATKVVTNSGAASIILTPQINFAPGNGVSLGFSFPYSHYLDSGGAPGKRPNLNGLDGNVLLDIHAIKREKHDLMIGMQIGLAGIRYNPKDGTGDIYGSLGRSLDFHLMSRIYQSDKMAFIIRLGIPSYKFTQFGRNTFDTYTIKFNGVSFGTGVTFNLGGGEE